VRGKYKISALSEGLSVSGIDSETLRHFGVVLMPGDIQRIIAAALAAKLVTISAMPEK